MGILLTLSIGAIIIGLVASQKISNKSSSNSDTSHKRKLPEDAWTAFLEGKISLSPEQFFMVRSQMFKRKHIMTEFEGVYVIKNIENGCSYVGQSLHVIDRVHAHLRGRGGTGNSGSTLLYHDFLNGDQFRITVIPLRTSEYNTLNELERVAITLYDSYHNGYNKTRGTKSKFVNK